MSEAHAALGEPPAVDPRRVPVVQVWESTGVEWAVLVDGERVTDMMRDRRAALDFLRAVTQALMSQPELNVPRVVVAPRHGLGYDLDPVTLKRKPA